MPGEGNNPTRLAVLDLLAPRKDACFSSPQDADGIPADATGWQLLGAALLEAPLQVLGNLAEVEVWSTGTTTTSFATFMGLVAGFRRCGLASANDQAKTRECCP
jgi:hypothetical protein